MCERRQGRAKNQRMMPCAGFAPSASPGSGGCLEAVLVALRPTTEELLARINDVIDARVALVDVIAARIVADVVLGEARLVRGGIKRQDVMGDGIEAICRNNISRERRGGLPGHSQ